MIKSAPFTPIMNKEEFLAGETQVIAPMFEVIPTKMSMMDDVAAYCIEDERSRVYIVSIATVARFGWDKLNLPESDAYKTHITSKIAKYGKQIVE